MNIKKHIEQNSDNLLAIVRVAASLTVTTTAIVLMVQKRNVDRMLGAASLVIEDLGGDAADLVSKKLIEYSGK